MLQVLHGYEVIVDFPKIDSIWLNIGDSVLQVFAWGFEQVFSYL